jgi:hypothetical protein
MPLNRRQLALGGAGVVLLVLAAWTLWPATPAPAPAPALPAATARPTGGKAPAGGVAALKLDALKASREGPGTGARNPFRFQPKVVAPPPRPVVTPPPAIVSTAPPPPPGPPPLPPIALKFTGVVERANGVKWAVLVDGKGNLMYGKDGDIIDGRYVIAKIGTESIEMTYTDGRGRQVIRLTGQ